MPDPARAVASPHTSAAGDTGDEASPWALERRFGGLRRLYGDDAFERLRAARLAVIGLGGVGSWTAEALARSGVGTLVLIDMDHVAESNIHRQVQALDSTLGAAKGLALRDRIADIHPDCHVIVVDDFVTPSNWPELLPCAVDSVVDACDQASAKVTLAAWSLRSGVPLIACGAAGGKRMPQRVEVADLGAVSHDPLLASVRRRMRRHHGAPRQGTLGVPCVFSCEPVLRPRLAAGAGGFEGNLACHGYGSTVTVTATFGMVAAAQALEQCLWQPG